MRGDTDSSPHVPQMRALLFTDLCDSTTLVERIGDAAAAELFQQHDRLVLAMQQRWRGQQIDRSDGLFLLFERPVDALGFALDYQQGLRQLGQGNNVPLLARAGLHVGEVILWKNSAEAVALGSKAVEVEGLAKPMAARLMQLARPGQILLSATAESMVRRAADGMGEVGNGLKWKSFGRWRFKGVAQPMDVFGVVSPTVPPVGRPRATPKAMRDIPLWRRPMTMVAEATFAVTLVVGVWLMTRPAPAIAFVERDWVVLGSLHNKTGDPLLGDALQQAFRISLEQSQYVNVLSEMKIRETLRNMQRDPGELLDRASANEVAIRDGAKAVIMPSAVEVHGKLRISVEVLDPVSGRTVYAEHADGLGLESALASTDRVVASMRTRLGETVQSIGRASSPLPQVATGSLDALHAYATGMKAYGELHYADALGFFEQAARFDPGFASAYLAQMRVLFASGDNLRARELLARAEGLSNRLPPRDRLYLDAWSAELQGKGVAESAIKWKLLGDLYPDYHAAHANRANALFSLGEYAASEQEAGRAVVPQNPLRSLALQMRARARFAQQEVEAAIIDYRTVLNAGKAPPNRELASALATTGDYGAANRMLDSIPADSLPAWIQRIAVALDEGSPGQARIALAEATRRCRMKGHVCNVFRVQGLTLDVLSSDPPSVVVFRQALQSMYSDAQQADGADRAEWAFMGTAGLYLAQRAGYDHVAEEWIDRYAELGQALADPRALQMVELVRAVSLFRDGHQHEAIERLRAGMDGRELFQAHVSLHDMYLDSGQPELAEGQRHWVAEHTGLAYVENPGTYALMALNLGDVHRLRQ